MNKRNIIAIEQTPYFTEVFDKYNIPINTIYIQHVINTLLQHAVDLFSYGDRTQNDFNCLDLIRESYFPPELCDNEQFLMDMDNAYRYMIIYLINKVLILDDKVLTGTELVCLKVDNYNIIFEVTTLPAKIHI